ncbi:MAG: leucine-rich repeat domain-containing protein [Clostridia bacterium]|nr:leucine-rich repeat domain-containing protein [Clostridia bacterium]
MRLHIRKPFLALLLLFVFGAACALSVRNGAFIRPAKADTEGEAYAEGDFSYVLSEDGSACITEYLGTETVVNIPAKLGGRVVSAIGDDAFSYNEDLTAVNIPKALKTPAIGDGAFAGCKNLRRLSAPESVLSIGNDAFSDCDVLCDLDFRADRIGDRAFSNCPRLVVLELKGGTPVEIGEYAFSDCGALQTVTISCPCNIAESAFSSCGSLVSAELNAQRIEDNAFADCPSLDTFVITSKEPCSIGEWVCSGSESLGAVVLPASVISVGEWSFADSDKLTIYADRGTEGETYAEDFGFRSTPVKNYVSYTPPAGSKTPWKCPDCKTNASANFCLNCGRPSPTPARTPAPTPVPAEEEPETIWGCDNYEDLYDMYPDEFEDLDEAEEFWDLYF